MHHNTVALAYPLACAAGWNVMSREERRQIVLAANVSLGHITAQQVLACRLVSHFEIGVDTHHDSLSVDGLDLCTSCWSLWGAETEALIHEWHPQGFLCNLRRVSVSPRRVPC